MSDSLIDLAARQLNDHRESRSGAVQDSFFSWNKNHIEAALELAKTAALDWFAEDMMAIKEHIVDVSESESGAIYLCDECPVRFGEVLSVVINGVSHRVNRLAVESYSLFILLSGSKLCGGDAPNVSVYQYSVADSSSCIIQFDIPPPANAVLRYTCASRKKLEQRIEAGDYNYIILPYMMFILHLMDNESRSSLERAHEYFNAFEREIRLKILYNASFEDEAAKYGSSRTQLPPQPGE